MRKPKRQEEQDQDFGLWEVVTRRSDPQNGVGNIAQRDLRATLVNMAFLDT